MSNRNWVDPRLPQIRVAGVRSYLRGQGWRLQPYPGPELLVFEGPHDDDGQPIVQVLPSSEQMRDFPLRIEELISALGILENRSPHDIVSDILKENTQEQQPESVKNGADIGLDTAAGKRK
jgi:hypothetical protein